MDTKAQKRYNACKQWLFMRRALWQKKQPWAWSFLGVVPKSML